MSAEDPWATPPGPRERERLRIDDLWTQEHCEGVREGTVTECGHCGAPADLDTRHIAGDTVRLIHCTHCGRNQAR